MKLQNPSFNFFLKGGTSQKQYDPHFFKVGGITRNGNMTI